MNIQKSVLTWAVLTVASAMFWISTAVAAPLPPSYPRNSGVLFDSAAQPIDILSIGKRHGRIEEVLVSLPSNFPPEAIDALARHHRLTHLESLSDGTLGTTIHRWRILDGRSIPDVILALAVDGGIEAQPNNSYVLQ